MAQNATLESLYRYPVKGFSPERLEHARLESGKHFPGDRLYAIENGPSGYDPKVWKHQPKIKYLMLMRQERLARLKTSYDDASGVLTIRQGGEIAASGDLGSSKGREAIEAFFASYMGDELRGPPKVLTAHSDRRFTDSRSGFVSLINLASVEKIARAAGREDIDYLRFRGNLMVAGMDPWAEFDLTGKLLRIGGAVLRGIKPIERCAATNVDPSTGIRDMRIPELLQREFGHADCGVYLEVLEGGVVNEGDRVEIA